MRAVSVILLTMLSLGVSAQEKVKITMREAVELGLAHNFDIQIAEEQVSLAENNNNIGNAGFSPNINGGFNSNNQFSNNQTPASFLQGKFNTNSASPFVQLDWVMFDGFRAWAESSRLTLLEEQSQGNTRIIVESTVQGIILAYYFA